MPRGTRRALIRTRRWWSEWYLAGGSPAPLAAYQPKGAFSYAASLTNCAAPGGYDAISVLAPAWSASTGWTFTAANAEKLHCPYTPLITDDNNLTMIMRVANCSGTWYSGADGQFGTESIALGFNSVAGQIRYYYGNSATEVAALPADTVLCISGTNGYRDGIDKADVSANLTTNFGSAMIGIGSDMFYDGSYNYHMTGSILAWALYKGTPLDATMVAAVSSAMAAL